MKIVICDDHHLVTMALSVLFESHGHQVVATLTSPEQLLETAATYRPDACVIDLYYDSTDGIGATVAAIAATSSIADVIVVSGHLGEADRRAVLDAGASATIDKSQVGDSLVAVVEGRTGLDDLVHPVVAPKNPFFLTPRELEVLHRLAEGDTTERMARHFGMAEATVRSHVQSLLIKLNVHNRSAAVAVAVRTGLVSMSR